MVPPATASEHGQQNRGKKGRGERGRQKKTKRAKRTRDQESACLKWLDAIAKRSWGVGGEGNSEAGEVSERGQGEAR